MTQHRKRALTTFWICCAADLLLVLALQIRRVYKIFRYEDHMEFPLPEPVVLILLLGFIIASAVAMRYVYLQAKKAELTWLKIVSLILQIVYFAMPVVGGLGLLLGMLAG